MPPRLASKRRSVTHDEIHEKNRKLSSRLALTIITCEPRRYSTPDISLYILSPQPYKLHKINDDGPSTSVTVTSEDALKYYRQMVVIRRMETAANAMYKSKLIRGFCHLYSGQVSDAESRTILYLIRSI